MNPRFALTTALALAFCTSVVHAAVIDFESVPGGSPSDQLAITSQYEPLFGVTFSLSSGDSPYLEAVGGADAGDGFVNNALNAVDVAAPGFEPQLQGHFLRIGTTGLAAVPVPRLLISYTTPVAAASAQIWDIDGDPSATEQWQVEAFNSGGALVASLLSPLGTSYGVSSLDGKPWTWSFDRGGVADIASISLTFVGSKTSGIGLAFDNFSPSSPAPAVPEPGALALAVAGGLTVLAWGRRQRRARMA
ncbi:MAG TPA: hypothetical protein VFW84_00275 [Aquabacterium sp.]|uniref:hypothetical protein n=1 Tax=Aquabacterium sp. TaxID=1872578 RepID=UPI002E34D6F0|nr:hypothetical protein [Aquabacterium sp.]HEX5371146.1 hypothetical protein [Aquabacterium sp.]